MHLTQHAKDKMPERDLTPTDVKEIIRRGRELPARDGCRKYRWFCGVAVVDRDRVVTAYRRW